MEEQKQEKEESSEEEELLEKMPEEAKLVPKDSLEQKLEELKNSKTI